MYIPKKITGIRAQAHKFGETVRLFSRTLNDVTHSYPEVAGALQRISGNFMLDGELVAMREGQVLPFRYLQARLSRKSLDNALLRDVPVAYAVFDLMARGEDFLIDSPLLERRERLDETIVPDGAIFIAPMRTLGAPFAAEQLHEYFTATRAAGHEGLMLKRTDSPYHPGRRGKWWLKLKRELETLDCVVVAVEWGHGKRAKVLSDYTFAVKAANGELMTIGKAYSGLTDAEIAELTPWFLEHRLPQREQRAKARAYEIPVEPRIVIEVAFDIIQQSDLHESGFSLRFPRIVRLRSDKPPSEIDTIDRVRQIYREMLERERVEPLAP